MNNQIFISYSRKDKVFALKLAKDLKTAGVDVWIDQLDIPPGKRWDNAIEDALDECKLFMVILSPVSVKSDDVRDEIAYALDEGKEIIPVLSIECKIPLRIRRLNYIDFTGNYELGKTKLIAALQEESSQEITETNEPSEPQEERQKNQPTPDEWYDKGLSTENINLKIKYFSTAIEQNPAKPEYFNERGRANHSSEQYNQAIQDYNQAIKLNSKDPVHFYNRGLAYYYLTQYNKAIQDYNKAIKMNPEDPDYFYNRGLAYRNSAKYRNAAADYNKYLELGGSNEDDAEDVRQWIRDLGYKPKY